MYDFYGGDQQTFYKVFFIKYVCRTSAKIDFYAQSRPLIGQVVQKSLFADVTVAFQGVLFAERSVDNRQRDLLEAALEPG
jgi:hypothetical protein